MKKLNIAILGATSHIAKGLIFNFIKEDKFRLDLYSRSAQRINAFFRSIGKSRDKICTIREGYDNFHDGPSYDVIINCVGVGSKKKLKGDYSLYFTVTEEYDNLVIDYLRNRNPEALYISLSSGAVYGRGHLTPVEENSRNIIKVNHICPEDYYAIARLNAETKHRALNRFRIIDLRIFAYFSRFIDLTEGYFITDIMNCILNRKVLVTDTSDIVRDYLHPEDLFSIIKKCIDTKNINKAYDVFSLNPVKKNQILSYFSSEYGLEHEFRHFPGHSSTTGFKNIYCSKYNSASSIGYSPKFTSLDVIKKESAFILL